MSVACLLQFGFDHMKEISFERLCYEVNTRSQTSVAWMKKQVVTQTKLEWWLHSLWLILLNLDNK